MKNTILLIIVSILFFYSNLNAQWVPTGFKGSGVTSIVAKEGKLFASTWGSYVYSSTDGGVSWTQDTTGFANWFYTAYIYDLAVVPASDNSGSTNLFAAMEEGGIWRSTNDGASWEWVYPLGVLGEKDINFVALGVAGSTILGGVETQPGQNGVYRSSDDGVSWTICNAGFQTTADSSVTCFTSIKVGSTTYFYAGTAGGLFISTTDGNSWTRISNGLPAGIITAIAAAPGNGASAAVNLFAGIGYSGIYHSSDNGSSWTAVNNGIPTMGTTPYINSMVASPVPNGTTSNIFAADGNVYISTNNGAEWLDTGWPVSNISSPACLSIIGGTLYGGGYQIWKYSILTDTEWVIQQSGTTDSLWSVKAVDNNVVWAGGTQGCVLKTVNGGASWDSVGGGILGTDNVFAIEPLDANTAFASTSVLSISGNSSTKIFKTTNGGSSWTQVFSQPGGFICGIHMQSATLGYAVGSPVGGKWTVIKTTDGGNSWIRLTTEPTAVTGEYGLLTFQVLGNNIWFGSSTGNVYRSTDLGVTWNSITTTGSLTSSLHFNSLTAGLVGFYNGTTNSSTNAGTSWDSAGSAGKDVVSCISGIGNEFWATTGNGIAYSNNAGQSWSFSSPGHWGLLSLNAVSISPVTSQINGWAVGESGLILHYQRLATSVQQNSTNLPDMYGLEQNYPNPFNPNTSIRYELPFESKITIMVYNILGQKIRELVNNSETAGIHEVNFNSNNLASGIYLYRLNAASTDGKKEFSAIKKMVLLK